MWDCVFGSRTGLQVPAFRKSLSLFFLLCRCGADNTLNIGVARDNMFAANRLKTIAVSYNKPKTLRCLIRIYICTGNNTNSTRKKTLISTAMYIRMILTLLQVSSLSVKLTSRSWQNFWGDQCCYGELLTVCGSRLPSVIPVRSLSNSLGRTQAKTLRDTCRVASAHRLSTSSTSSGRSWVHNFPFSQIFCVFSWNTSNWLK